MSFAYWLKYYRNKAGYTQKEVASKLCMTRQNYSRYENEKLNILPPLKTLCDLAYLLKTDPNSLIGFEPKIDEMDYAKKYLPNIKEKDGKIFYGFVTHEEAERLKLPNTSLHDIEITFIEIPKTDFIKFVELARNTVEEWISTNTERFRKDIFTSNMHFIMEAYYTQKKAAPNAPTSETEIK